MLFDKDSNRFESHEKNGLLRIDNKSDSESNYEMTNSSLIESMTNNISPQIDNDTRDILTVSEIARGPTSADDKRYSGILSFNNLLDSAYAYDSTFTKQNPLNQFSHNFINYEKKDNLNKADSQSSNNNSHESFDKSMIKKRANDVNGSVLDVVEFIEVNNELVNSEQEFRWLCDPKKSMRLKKHLNKESLKEKTSANEKPIEVKKSLVLSTDPGEITTTTQSHSKKTIKNPYKWIMEEFENRNLDKVKRNLLVTLDDISKGTNRRSRSVSMTRTPYAHHINPNQFVQQSLETNKTNNSEYQQPDRVTQRLQNDRTDQNDFQQNSNVLKEINNNQSVILKSSVSKSVENILNETVTVSSENTPNENQPQSNYINSGTIIKRKNQPRGLSLSSIQRNLELSNEIVYDDSNSSSKEQQQQYEDFTDVQVIAKMQEETLRQSILNINKKTDSDQNYSHRDNSNTINKHYPSPTHHPTSDENYHENQSQNPHHTRYHHFSQSQLNLVDNTERRNEKPKSIPHSSTGNFLIRASGRLNESSSTSRIFNKRVATQQIIPKSSTMTNYNMNQKQASAFNSQNSKVLNSLARSHNNSSRSTTPSNIPDNTNDSRLPTPRNSRISMEYNKLMSSINKPPPAPQQKAPSRRAPIAYGGQRSATTSIVPMIGGKSVFASSPSPAPTHNKQTSWQKTKYDKIQQEKMIQQDKQQHIETPANNNRSPQSNTEASNSTISPSSSSSLSNSSSVYQISPNNPSSPKSRNISPLDSYESQNYKTVKSPSGLLTDGPMVRRPIISSSPMRERSQSPVCLTDTNHEKNNHHSTHLLNQTYEGSNTSLNSVLERKNQAKFESPLVNKKQSHSILKKSFLPQPVQYQQSAVKNRQLSISPIRNSLGTQERHITPNWKDGCY